MKMKGLLRREDGAAALEFAIVAPVLVLLVAGLIQVGIIAQTALVANNAAREGARYAAVSDDNALAAARAADYVDGVLGGRGDLTLPSAQQISIDGVGIGQPVTVTVPVSVKVTTPLMSKLLGSSVHLNGSATMLRSQ